MDSWTALWVLITIKQAHAVSKLVVVLLRTDLGWSDCEHHVCYCLCWDNWPLTWINDFQSKISSSVSFVFPSKSNLANYLHHMITNPWSIVDSCCHVRNSRERAIVFCHRRIHEHHVNLIGCNQALNLWSRNILHGIAFTITIVSPFGSQTRVTQFKDFPNVLRNRNTSDSHSWERQVPAHIFYCELEIGTSFTRSCGGVSACLNNVEVPFLQVIIIFISCQGHYHSEWQQRGLACPKRCYIDGRISVREDIFFIRCNQFSWAISIRPV